MSYNPLKEDVKRRCFVYTYDDEDGCTHEADMPGKLEVCSRCGGTGAHDPEGFGDVTDAVREDRDFAEEYFQGRYDVQCTTCRGRNVQLVLDEKNCDPKLLDHYYGWCEDEQYSRMESEAERRMRC